MNATAITTTTTLSATPPAFARSRREVMITIDSWMTAAADAAAGGYIESANMFSALAANEIALLALRNSAGVTGWAV